MQVASAVQNRELMARARKALQGQWGLAVAGFSILLAINFLLSWLLVDPLPSLVVNALLAGPFALGISTFSLALSRRSGASLPQLFEGFDGFRRFGGAIMASVLTTVLIVLWSLLLVIPGLVAALSYSMTFYVLAENREIQPLDAISESKRIMRGSRTKYFLLVLRFVGWFLLVILTLGLALLWVSPYLTVSFAQFYDDVRRRDGSEMDGSGARSSPGTP